MHCMYTHWHMHVCVGAEYQLKWNSTFIFSILLNYLLLFKINFSNWSFELSERWINKIIRFKVQTREIDLDSKEMTNQTSNPFFVCVNIYISINH